jgi:glycosyltransferase involved in cell wall biosynthesis
MSGCARSASASRRDECRSLPQESTTTSSSQAGGARLSLTCLRWEDSETRERTFPARRKGLAQRLVLAGAGAAPSDLRELACDLGVAALVSFEESVSEARLRELYQGASVLALASFEEGLGLVLLEALACGTPVVATATEGAKEVMARGGEISLKTGTTTPTPPLAMALCDWAERGMTPVSRASARAFATREFGNHVALRRFTDVYERMLRNGS